MGIDERTDGQTGIRTLTVELGNFPNAPKTVTEKNSIMFLDQQWKNLDYQRFNNKRVSVGLKLSTCSSIEGEIRSCF